MLRDVLLPEVCELFSPQPTPWDTRGLPPKKESAEIVPGCAHELLVLLQDPQEDFGHFLVACPSTPMSCLYPVLINAQPAQ